MANSLGSLTSNIVSSMMLELTLARLAPLMALSTDFSAEAIDFNQSLKVRTATPPTVSDYSTTNGYVAVDATTTDYTVTIDKHKHVTLAFNDQEISGTARRLLDEQVRVAAYALADQVLDDVLALVIAATFTNTAITETLAGTDRDTLVSFRQSLTNNAAPDVGRNVLMNVSAFGYLTADTKIISQDYNNIGNNDYRSGVLKNIQGFDNVFEIPNLPSTGNMQSFALHKSALVMAARLPKDPGAIGGNVMIPGSIETIQDENTGLALQVRTWYDMQKGKLNQTYTLMYGVAAGVIKHLTIAKTA
jgi:hypothetical protein